MSDKTTTGTSRMPGNDGTWFLKAAGVDTAATELGDVTRNAGSTSELVQELWDADLGQDALSGFRPEALSKQVQRKRNFRWPMVVAALLVLVAVAGFVLWLPGTSDARAADVAAEYEQSYAAVYADLAPAQQVLADFTEPEGPVPDEGEASVVITEMRTNAGDALVLATTPIPRAFPLAPTEPLTSLAPHRETLSVQATAAEAVARRLDDLVEYRMVSERLFDIGELPTRPQQADPTALSEQLAIVAADSATALDELPEDAAFAEHKDAVREALARFTDWQVEYVEALRLDNRAQAEALVTEWTAITEELEASRVNALARVRSEVDAEIIELAAAIDQSIASLDD